MISYRKLFCDHYGIKLDSCYDIHHIDGDRTNNDIRNLMILPKSLHAMYHSAKKTVSYVPLDIGSSMSMLQYYEFCSDYKKFCDIVSECSVWYDYKLYMDGEMDNVHNIKLRRG